VADVTTWNYRVVQAGETFEIREVYYDPQGEVVGYILEASHPSGESWEELRADLRLMRRALRLPVLSASDLKGRFQVSPSDKDAA
jgi:hypothetical protein